MFIAAKLLAFLTEPIAWLGLLVLAALALQRRFPRASQRLLLCTLALGLLLGWTPIPNALLHPLETRYAAVAPQDDLSAYTGVVVLGGALDAAYLWQIPGQALLNSAAERMTAVLPLLHRNPKLLVLFTGGEGDLWGQGLSEAERARRFFVDQGIPEPQLLLESASRTTFENAVLSKQLAGLDPQQRWLLLTSAWHMPRAMASFEAQGWRVTAYPVDYRSAAHTPWSRYSFAESLPRWRLALHEWLGLLAYRLSGQSR
jgi:uncharacterized SAM-binding protein YcdF (DUF218 family)